MKEQLDTLLKLQEIETEMADIELLLGSVSDRRKVLDGRLSEVKENLQTEETGVNDLKKTYRSLESDLKVNQSSIDKNREQLRSVKTNKEYQALLKGIDEINDRNSKIEDEMLKCLESIEESENDIKTRKKEYKKLKEQIDKDKEMIFHEADKGKKKLAGLDVDREKASGGIEAGLLEKFNKIKGGVGGIAITYVNNSVCNGCNLNIPPQMYNELQRFDKLHICPHCQRILYWRKSEE